MISGVLSIGNCAFPRNLVSIGLPRTRARSRRTGRICLRSLARMNYARGAAQGLSFRGVSRREERSEQVSKPRSTPGRKAECTPHLWRGPQDQKHPPRSGRTVVRGGLGPERQRVGRMIMRKWCAILAMGALCALPLAAQQSQGTEGKDTRAGIEIAANRGGNVFSGTRTVSPGVRSLWTLPAAPKPTPFPAAASATEEAPGRLLPRYELAGMYDYLNYKPGDPFNAFNSHGGTGSFAYNATNYLGLIGELGGYHFQRNVGGNQISGGLTSYLFGPRLNLRRFDHFVPFAEFLIGGAHAGSQLTGDQGANSFALATGGGVDIVLTKYVAWRFAQIDYFMTNFAGAALGQPRGRIICALERESFSAGVFPIPRHRRIILPWPRARRIRLLFTPDRMTAPPFT